MPAAVAAARAATVVLVTAAAALLVTGCDPGIEQRARYCIDYAQDNGGVWSCTFPPPR